MPKSLTGNHLGRLGLSMLSAAQSSPAVLTDIPTTWVETRAVWAKAKRETYHETKCSTQNKKRAYQTGQVCWPRIEILVLGELVCGTLQKREEILAMLTALSEAHLGRP